MQDELDDILRYGAAELFADAVAASKEAQEAAVAGDSSCCQATAQLKVCLFAQLMALMFCQKSSSYSGCFQQ